MRMRVIYCIFLLDNLFDIPYHATRMPCAPVVILRRQAVSTKHNIRVSYSCCQNMESIVRKHNREVIIDPNTDSEQSCNCRTTAHPKVFGGPGQNLTLKASSFYLLVE